MKKKIVSVLLTGAFLWVTVGAFVSCKDDNEDDYSNLQGQFSTELDEVSESLQNLIDEQENALTDAKAELEEKIEEVESKITTCECDFDEDIANLSDGQLEELASQLASYMAEEEAIEKAITDITDVLETSIDENSSDIDSLGNVTSSLEDTIQTLLDRIVVLDSTAATVEALTGVETRVITLETGLTGVRDSLNTLYATVYSDSVYLATFIKKYTTDSTEFANNLAALSDTCNSLRNDISTQLTNVYTYIDSVGSLIVDAYTKSEADSIADTLRSSLSELISEVEEGLTATIDSLKDSVSVLSTKVNANTTAIDSLTNRVEILEALMNARYVTSIIVQATENPSFGTLSMPVDITSYVLMNYWGTWDAQAGTFPTTASSYSYTGLSYLSDEQWDILVEAGLEAESYANGDLLYTGDREDTIEAGTIYLTVNPTNVDFEDLTVSLVNSQDEESGVKLSKLSKSNKTLTFGYTRSADDNGFYEASAYLPLDNIDDVKINIESGLKEEVTSALKALQGNDALDMTSLVSTIYNQFNGILDANAVKTSWTDDDGETYSVYSQYNVAATTFHPLSFLFAGLSYQIPTIGTLSYIDLGDYDEINIELDIDDIVIDDVASITFDNSWISTVDSIVHVEVVMPAQDSTENEDGTYSYYYQIDENGQIASDTVAIEVNLYNFMEEFAKALEEQVEGAVDEYVSDVIDEVVESINEQLSSIIDDINDQLSDINDLLDQLNGLQETADNYIDKINSYITKVDNVISRVNGYLSNFQDYLQVALMYETSDGSFGLLSTDKEFYHTMSAGGTGLFYPTTLTAEIGVPVVRKYIAVTNVYSGVTDEEGALGDDTLKELMIEANQSNDMLNTVLDGNTRAVDFTIPSSAESGDIFEITYAGLDYSGYMSYNKYYIGVK